MMGWRRRSMAGRAKAVRLLILDVDGVLTDGRIVMGPRGEESKAFHVADGLGLVLAREAGLDVVWISSRKSSAVARRAKELGIRRVFQGVSRKLAAYAAILRSQGLDDRDVAVMGDDLADLPLLRRAGLALTVPEAPAEVLAAAHWVSSRRGGHGAVREAVEMLLRARGVWSTLVLRCFGDVAQRS